MVTLPRCVPGSGDAFVDFLFQELAMVQRETSDASASFWKFPQHATTMTQSFYSVQVVSFPGYRGTASTLKSIAMGQV
ncbi:hypothetical protein CGRA01v4_00249 [Colletotrichum graminicola]|nr:hypothetical protein CGRA01v4_00249 [Colletotrichum graminicola]